MPLPVSFFSQSLTDYSDEKSNWSVPITTLTAANLAAQTTLIDNLKTAVAAITLMDVNKNETVVVRDIHAGVLPTNPLAQRENKWLIRYVSDASQKKFSVEIPGADLSLLSTAPQSDFMDSGSAEYAALKTAFEAIVRDPDDASGTVTMGTVQFVGRRL